MKIKYPLFVFCLLFSNLTTVGQKRKLDSLWLIYNTTSIPDTSRLKSIETIVIHFAGISNDTAITLANAFLKLAKETRQKQFEGRALKLIGYSFFYKRNYSKALEHYTKAKNLFEEIGNNRELANTYSWIGIVYNYYGNHIKGIEYELEAIKIVEKSNNPKALADKYLNIGSTYFEIENFDKALEFWYKSLRISEGLKDSISISQTLHGIGNVYTEKKDYKLAVEYLNKALTLKEKLGDNYEIYNTSLALGTLYNLINEKSKALNHFQKALKIAFESGDSGDIANCYILISEYYSDNKDIKKGIIYAKKSLQLATENKVFFYISWAAKDLWKLNSKIGNYKEALANHEIYISADDSLQNVQSVKNFAEQEMRIKEEGFNAIQAKKEAQQAILDATKLEEKKKQQFVLYVIVGILLIVIIFSILLYKRFKVTNRQKQIIEEINREVEEKNKDIMDSIRYAKRIQTSLLPTDKYIDRILTEHDKSTRA